MGPRPQPQPQPRQLPLRLPRVQRLSPERPPLGRRRPPEPTRFPSPHRPPPASPAPRLRRRPLQRLKPGREQSTAFFAEETQGTQRTAFHRGERGGHLARTDLQSPAHFSLELTHPAYRGRNRESCSPYHCSSLRSLRLCGKGSSQRSLRLKALL